MLDGYMKKLAKEMGVDSFATPIPNTYSIPIDENVNVTVSEIPNGISVRCKIAEVPIKEQEELFTYAMTSNMLGKGTGGSLLSLDEEGKNLFLTRDITQPIKYHDFEYLLEDFFNIVDTWREETASYGKN